MSGFPSLARPKGDGPTVIDTPQNRTVRADAVKELNLLLDGAVLRGTHGTFALKVVVVDGVLREVIREIEDHRRYDDRHEHR